MKSRFLYILLIIAVSISGCIDDGPEPSNELPDLSGTGIRDTSSGPEETAPNQEPEIPECQPDWKCSAWSGCNQSNAQKRNCTDMNNCSSDEGRPPAYQYCIPQIVKPNESKLTLNKWTNEEGIRASGVSSCTIINDSEYWMYYTGRGIELARSSDGLEFIRVGTVFDVMDASGVDMVTNPAVFQLKSGKYRMIYEGSTDRQFIRKLYSAVSDDGLRWTAEAGVRLEDGIFLSDPEKGRDTYTIFTSVPDIIRLEDGCLRMYYTVVDESRTARSCDEGLTWIKEGTLKLRKVAIDPDIVLLDDRTYILFFTTFEDEFGVGEQWVMSAASVDGRNFVLNEEKLIRPAASGGLVTDPDVLRVNNGYRMYYSEFGLRGYESNILSAFSSA